MPVGVVQQNQVAPTTQQVGSKPTSKMTLDEKIEFTQARTDSLIKRVNCCMYFFLVTALFFLWNAYTSFRESRNWAHFIA